MSVARFIADQRTIYAVPHTLVCALLGVSLAWFYKWIKRADGPGAASGLFTDTDRRRDAVDRAVKVAFKDAKGLHGSPRLHADLRDRLLGLLDDPDRSLTELPVVLLPCLWHLVPHCGCLYAPGGTSPGRC